MDKITETERKTFVFFSNWAEALEDFAPADRCAVYDAIVAYARDGTVPQSLDRAAATAFKFIRKDIDEMRDKYEDICNKRREAVNKRWRKVRGTSDDTIAHEGEVQTADDTNEYMSVQALHSEHEHEHEHEHGHEHGLETTKKNLCSRRSRDVGAEGTRGGGYDDAGLIERFFAEERKASIEAMAMNLRVSPDELLALGRDVVNEWRLSEKTHRDYNDAARHLQTVIRAKVDYNRRNRASGPGKTSAAEAAASTSWPGLGVGEFRDSLGRRTYSTGGVLIPETARPRPSERHWWNRAMNDWCDNMC